MAKPKTDLMDSKDDEGKKGGRPIIKLSDSQKIEVKALAQYLSQEQIADYLGVTRKTFAAIIERDPEVFTHYKKGKATAVVSVAKGLVQKAIAGDTTAMIFFLKTQAGWKESQNIDHTSSDGSMTPKGRSLNDFYAETNVPVKPES